MSNKQHTTPMRTTGKMKSTQTCNDAQLYYFLSHERPRRIL